MVAMRMRGAIKTPHLSSLSPLLQTSTSLGPALHPLQLLHMYAQEAMRVTEKVEMATCKYGANPILGASRAGDLASVQALLAAGCDVDAQDKVSCHPSVARSLELAPFKGGPQYRADVEQYVAVVVCS